MWLTLDAETNNFHMPSPPPPTLLSTCTVVTCDVLCHFGRPARHRAAACRDAPVVTTPLVELPLWGFRSALGGPVLSAAATATTTAHLAIIVSQDV